MKMKEKNCINNFKGMIFFCNLFIIISLVLLLPMFSPACAQAFEVPTNSSQIIWGMSIKDLKSIKGKPINSVVAKGLNYSILTYEKIIHNIPMKAIYHFEDDKLFQIILECNEKNISKDRFKNLINQLNVELAVNPLAHNMKETTRLSANPNRFGDFLLKRFYFTDNETIYTLCYSWAEFDGYFKLRFDFYAKTNPRNNANIQLFTDLISGKTINYNDMSALFKFWDNLPVWGSKQANIIDNVNYPLIIKNRAYLLYKPMVPELDQPVHITYNFSQNKKLHSMIYSFTGYGIKLEDTRQFVISLMDKISGQLDNPQFNIREQIGGTNTGYGRLGLTCLFLGDWVDDNSLIQMMVKWTELHELITVVLIYYDVNNKVNQEFVDAGLQRIAQNK